jgi:uncharacterized membrane protein YfcA
MNRRPRFQFSIRWLFVATTVAAIVAATVARIEAPRFARNIIGAYFIIWATYLTFQLFRIVQVIADSRRRLQQIRQSRQVANDPPERAP